MEPNAVAPSDEPVASQPADLGGLTSPARQEDEPIVETVALSAGRPLAAADSGHHIFRFGMKAFLVGSVLFSLQFLAWNLLGVFYGSLVNVTLILLVTAGAIAWGAIAGAIDPKHDRFWDQALVRGAMAFYLMAAVALLAGGGQVINEFVQAKRIRHLAHDRYGFEGTERFAIDGDGTVTLISVEDADPAGLFAQAGIAPGQAIVLTGSSRDFYDRLLAAESDSMSVTLVAAPSPGQSVGADITRKPKRRATIDLRRD